MSPSMLIFFKVDCDVLPKLVSFEKARVANISVSDVGLHGQLQDQPRV